MIRRTWLLTLSLVIWMPGAVMGQSILLKGGTIVDGTGAPPRRGDVEIEDGRITAVGEGLEVSGALTVDVTGLIVAPGFIDLHSHAEAGLSDPHRSAALNNVTQGITTVVVGQDGLHAWPLGSSLGEQTAVWRERGIGTNIVPLVGRGIARVESIGPSRDPATAEQSQRIADRVEASLAEGAWGLSTGLGYFPGRNSSTEEIIDSARRLAGVDGFYISHLRDQGGGLLESIDEAIRICREASVRCVITHIKTAGRPNWGKAGEAIARIAAAREAGLAVYADLYPYRASDDGVDFTLVPVDAVFDRDEIAELFAPVSIAPELAVRWSYRLDPGLHFSYRLEALAKQPWPLVSGLIGVSDRVRREPAYRYRIREQLDNEEGAAKLLDVVRSRIGADEDAAHILVTRHPEPTLVGASLRDVAEERSVTAERAAVELTLESATFTRMQMAEEDIAAFLREPWVAGGTDGRVPEYGAGITHPRSYGTFPRRLRRYVLDEAIVDLPFAIRTASALPAEIIGLPDRGLIRVGYWADVVVLDPETVRDRATYSDPHRYSDGIEWVLVNGEPVVREGRPTGHKPGRVLLKTGS